MHRRPDCEIPGSDLEVGSSGDLFQESGYALHGASTLVEFLIEICALISVHGFTHLSNLGHVISD